MATTAEIHNEVVAGSKQFHVIGESDLLDVTLVLSTDQYASGDVLVVPQEIAGAMRVNGGTGVIQSIEVLDKDDQGGILDLVFFSESASLGTINAAVSISDTDAALKLGTVEIVAADYVDFINSQSVTIPNVGIGLKAAADSRSLWIGAISRDTKTYTASGIVLRIFILQD